MLAVAAQTHPENKFCRGSGSLPTRLIRHDATKRIKELCLCGELLLPLFIVQAEQLDHPFVRYNCAHLPEREPPR